MRAELETQLNLISKGEADYLAVSPMIFDLWLTIILIRKSLISL